MMSIVGFGFALSLRVIPNIIRSKDELLSVHQVCVPGVFAVVVYNCLKLQLGYKLFRRLL